MPARSASWPAATARSSEQDYHIEGLITLPDVSRLVAAGYRVTVEAPEHARARAQKTASLGEQGRLVVLPAVWLTNVVSTAPPGRYGCRGYAQQARSSSAL